MKKILTLGLISAVSSLACASTHPQQPAMRYFFGVSLGKSYMAVDRKFADQSTKLTPSSSTNIFSAPLSFQDTLDLQSPTASLRAGAYWGALRFALEYRYAKDPAKQTAIQHQVYEVLQNQIHAFVYGPIQNLLKPKELQSHMALLQVALTPALKLTRVRPLLGLVLGYEDSSFEGSYSYHRFQVGHSTSYVGYDRKVRSSARGLVYGAAVGASFLMNENVRMDATYEYLKHNITHKLDLSENGDKKRYARLEIKESGVFMLSANYLF